MLDENIQSATSDAQKLYMLDQQEVSYVPVSVIAGKACSSCRWFVQGYNEPDSCRIVMSWDEPIVSNGYCDRHETMPRLVELDAEPIPVVIVEPPMSMDDTAEMSLNVPKNLVERVKEFISSIRSRATPEPAAFTVCKAKNGRNAWVSRHTGKWVDREGEILSEKSHEAYVERVQKGIVPMPELWMWHAKGTRHGQAVAVWKSGGFVLAAGLFDETPAGERAFNYYQKHSGKIKLSHMFHYPRETKISGVYHEYNTIEITTLPDGAEAFPYTSFTEIQTMSIPDAARSMINEALGEDVLRQAEAADGKAVQDTKTLEGQGVASKGYDQYGDSEVLSAAQKVQAVEQAQTAADTRLKTVEETMKELADLPAAFKAMSETIKTLTEQVETSQRAEADALGKIKELEGKLAFLTDLKPPASKSDETLLVDREKSFIDSVMESAKSGDQSSLIETLMGGKPNIHS